VQASAKMSFLAKYSGPHTPADNDQADYANLVHCLANIEIYTTSIYDARNLLGVTFFGPSDTKIGSTLSHSFAGEDPATASLTRLIRDSRSVGDLAEIAKALSPLFFLEGSCIQNVNMAGFHHSLLSARVMKVFMTVWGYLEPLASHFHFYDTLLRTMRVYLPDLPSKAFVTSEIGNIPTQVFKLGAIQLALAHFPRALFPEILGFLDQSLRTNQHVLQAIIRKLDLLGAPACESKTAEMKLKQYETIRSLTADIIKMYLDEVSISENHADYEKYAARINYSGAIYRGVLDEITQHVARKN